MQFFNPTGEIFISPSQAADNLIEEGNEYLRTKNYSLALKSFNKAIAKDSIKTGAWVGAAKATMRKSGFNSLDLVEKFAVKKREIPFENDHDSIKTRYFSFIRLYRSSVQTIFWD